MWTNMVSGGRDRRLFGRNCICHLVVRNALRRTVVRPCSRLHCFVPYNMFIINWFWVRIFVC